MTDTPLPDDELASALVDGLGDDQQRALLASDPALAARVEQLRAVRRAVARSAGDVPTPAPTTREQAIAAALAAAPPHQLQAHQLQTHELQAQKLPAQELPADAPADLDARRERRSRPAWLPAAAAAAVVAVLGLGAFAALRDRGADSDTNVTAAADAPGTTLAGTDDAPRDATFEAAGATTTAAAGGSADGATSGQSAATTAAGAATTAAAAPPPTAPSAGAPAPTAMVDSLPDLGPLDSAAALRAALVALPPVAERPVTDEPGTEIAVCATDPGGRPVARLTWVGQPALVLVVDGPPSRAVVVTAADCHPLAEVPLP